MNEEMNKIENFSNIELDINISGYTTDDGTVYVNLHDVCIGLGFVDNTHVNKFSPQVAKNKSTYIRWNRVLKYMNSLDYTYDPIQIKKEETYVPEKVFYGLALKAKNGTAKKFQKWIAEEVIPSIRRTGIFASKKYDPIRAMSVFIRKLEASSISKLAMYYKIMNCPFKKTALFTEFSTMVNSLAKISNGERNKAATHQLAIIMFAELNIRDIIERGIGEKMDPDDIKGVIWDWLLQFTDCITKTDTPEKAIHKAKLKKFHIIK